MPGGPINRADWPTGGPHRELLELLDGLHRKSGLPSSREISKRLHVSHTRVHSLLRGKSLPVDAGQARALVAALAAEPTADEAIIRRAVELYYAARAADAAADGAEPASTAATASPADAPEPAPATGSPGQAAGRRARRHALVVAGLVLAVVAVVAWRPGACPSCGS